MRKLFAMLAAGILLTLANGCGRRDAAEKRLNGQLKMLADNYIAGELMRQVRENPQCIFFQVHPNSIWLLSDDGTEVFRRDTKHSDLIEYAISRFYAAAELQLSCSKVLVHPLQEVDHERFAYRTLLDLQLREVKRFWTHTPAAGIALCALKEERTADSLKQELFDQTALQLLPVEYDYRQMYEYPTEVSEREYSIAVYAVYDPALPGWVLEDVSTAIQLPPLASWAAEDYKKPTLPPDVSEYKGYFYWKNSDRIKAQYDNGMVFRFGKWMTLAAAEETMQCRELTDKFNPEQATCADLGAFLLQVNSFSPEVDRSGAVAKAVAAAEKNLDAFRNANDYRNLMAFDALLRSKSEFGLIAEPVQKRCSEYIDVVKKRINRNLSDAVQSIQAVQISLQELIADDKLSAMQVNIQSERITDIIRRNCIIKQDLLRQDMQKIHLGALLVAGDMSEISRFYLRSESGRQLRNYARTALMKKCNACTDGRQSCLHCSDLPGKCQLCCGNKWIKDEICTDCHGSGVCERCRGERQIKCLLCHGRRLLIDRQQTSDFMQKCLKDLNILLNDNINELDSRMIK